jgi:hypothetical protein
MWTIGSDQGREESKREERPGSSQDRVPTGRGRELVRGSSFSAVNALFFYAPNFVLGFASFILFSSFFYFSPTTNPFIAPFSHHSSFSTSTFLPFLPPDQRPLHSLILLLGDTQPRKQHSF